MTPATPYYLIDEARLLDNLEKIKYVREISCVRVLLALKCFAAWGVSSLIGEYLDGTTASSPFEARLGKEEFKGETHVYSVGYSEEDIGVVLKYADTIIFNSANQLERFYHKVKNKSLGLRINPRFGYSPYSLSNPFIKGSRLGESLKRASETVPLFDGALFHYNCENDDYEKFSKDLDRLSKKYGLLFDNFRWVSLGGGVSFTKKGYPLKKYARSLKNFSERHGLRVYIEPGDAVVSGCGELVCSVLDVLEKTNPIAIVDASTEAHMLDLLTYREQAIMDTKGPLRYTIAGRSCLAGDIFGTFGFKTPVHIGDEIKFKNAAAYSMVKMNWFNGLQMPSVVVKKLDGTLELRRSFSYKNFKANLS